MSVLRKIIASIVVVAFIFSNFQSVHAQDFSINQLPLPGSMVNPSATFAPLELKGLVVNPQKPLEFQFIVDTGKGPQDTSAIKEEANRLVKYFLAGLTIPEGDLWVNLSPYEKDRMTTDSLGKTELGRDLLAQDYILKQLTASLIYPEKDLGKEFWSRVYKQAQEKFGTTNVPVNTFNKVWILPNQAQVFENGAAAYVTQSTLRVMLDEDYTALQKNTVTLSKAKGLKEPLGSSSLKNVPQDDTHSLASQIVREIVIPQIEKEVNTGKNFAPLRQIYDAMILAKWYKETIVNGLLDAAYTNKKKVGGINLNDPAVKEQIYQRYLQAYKKGVFNYIKEDSTPNGQSVPKKYFSGGLTPMPKVLERTHDGAMLSVTKSMVAGALLLVTASCASVNNRQSINVGISIEQLQVIKNFSSPNEQVRISSISQTVNLLHSPKEDLFQVLDNLQKADLGPEHEAIVPELRKIIKTDYVSIGDRLLYGSVDVMRYTPYLFLFANNQYENSSLFMAGGGLNSTSYERTYKEFRNSQIHAIAADLLYRITGEFTIKGEYLFGNFTTREIDDTYVAFMMASQKNRKKEVEQLLLKEAEKYKEDALMVAARNGSKDVIEELLAKGTKIDTIDYNGRTSLMVASRDGNKDTVAFLISKGADSNKKDNSGQTALSLALKYQHKDIVNILKAAGAKDQAMLPEKIDQDPAMRSKFTKFGIVIVIAATLGIVFEDDIFKFFSPTVRTSSPPSGIPNQGIMNIDDSLLRASLNGDIERVKSAINSGVNVNATNPFGATFLIAASLGGRTQIVQYLVDQGADLNHMSANGATALSAAAETGSLVVTKVLVEKGANLNIQNHEGYTALMIAAQKKNKEVAEYLIKKGANINIRNKSGSPALMEVAINGDQDIAKSLLENGAEVNKPNDFGGTPLMLAAQKGNKEIVTLLISKQANVNLKDDHGEDALMNTTHKDIAEILINAGAHVNSQNAFGTTALEGVSQDGNKEIAQLLISKGADVNSADKNGITALMVASKQGWNEIVEMLLKNGAKVNVQDVHGLTAASFANGNLEVLKLLSSYKADLNIKSPEDITLLMSAAAEGHPDVVSFLLEKGVEIEGKDKGGVTALMLACAKGQKDIVEILLKNGANVNAKANDGLMPLDFVRNAPQNQNEIIKLLLEAQIKAKKDQAMQGLETAKNSKDLGGIDLNQININRTGKTIKVDFDPAQLNELMQGGFEGFSPVIINITPIASPFPLLGIAPRREEEVLVKL
jgi:ankyrin repeat protein